ncbi:fascin-3 [Pelodiscus sinensis]|uniref:fascin-3 n=1 Tax=Pelodiscus sinensis TaxID=13735 RepID=UPI003F6D469B
MKVGLISWAGSYLTSECYGDGVTVLGTSLGRKQTWELQVTMKQGKETVVELLGHQGRYLLVDPDGSVRCGQPAADQQSQFLLELHHSGTWTLQLLDSRKYLESDGEDVFCISRRPSAYHRWLPQLAMHVHIVLYSPAKQCYARADTDLDRVWVDTPVPYPEECGFVLRFKHGMYHLETSRHKYVSRRETLAKKPSTHTAFHLNLQPRCLAFLSDRDGSILYPQGKRGLLCLGDSPPEEEEKWFVIKRCPQWVSLKTKAKRYVSVICDTEVYAGSDKVTPTSIFRYEFDPETNAVQLKTVNNRYLAQRKFKSIMANGRRMEPETNFRAQWHYGKIFLQAFNGRYLGTLPIGLVVASAAHPGPSEALGVRLANRSFLVLRGRYGYVGSSACHDVLQCNLVDPDCIELLPCKPGIYHFQACGRSFWSLSADGTFRTWGKFALNFCLEIQGTNILAVLAPNGYYMRGDRNGTLLADSEEVTSECLWEF